MKGYYISRQPKTGEIIYINYDKYKQGYNISPKNTIKYDGVKVNKMIIVKPSMIEKVLKRKIKNRLDLYLKTIIEIMEDSDGDSSSGIREALNELSRFKNIIKYKYEKYLEGILSKNLTEKQKEEIQTIIEICKNFNIGNEEINIFEYEFPERIVPPPEGDFRVTAFKVTGKQKRFLDIFLSLIGLIILSPIFLIISIIIKIDSKGPIFYRQERVTRYGKIFRIFVIIIIKWFFITPPKIYIKPFLLQ